LYDMPELHSLIKKANKEYLYWDKFKHLTMPVGVTPEQAWLILKLLRRSAMKPLPLQDVSGKRFTYWQPEEVLRYLHLIDRDATGQLLIDEPGIDSASKDIYIISSLMEEAIASSQLEGAATTRRIAKRMLKSGRKPLNKAEQMILNNYVTIRKIQERAAEKLSIDMLKQIHVSITEDTLDNEDEIGRFRRDDEPIEIIDRIDGKTLHVPPAVHLLQDRIQALCDFANDDTGHEFIHPVIKAIVLHFWLAYDHPFTDGNGRTARAVFYWYLLSRKYWLVQYLSISKTILRAPAQYKRSFIYSEKDEADLTYFIMYNLKAIRLSISEVSNYLIRRQKEIRESMRLIRNIPNLNYRQYSLLQHALKHPDDMYHFKTHMNTHGISYQTARTDIMELKKIGLIDQIPTKKVLTFVPSPKLYKKIKHYSSNIATTSHEDKLV